MLLEVDHGFSVFINPYLKAARICSMNIFKQLKLSICTYYLIICPCNADLTPHFYIEKQGYIRSFC